VGILKIRLLAVFFAIPSVATAEHGVILFAKGLAEFICIHAGGADEKACLKIASRHLERAAAGAPAAKSVGELRRMALAFMDDDKFRSYVVETFLADKSTGSIWRRDIWDEFQVLVLPGGVKTPLGVTKSWTDEELKSLSLGYRLLRTAVNGATGGKAPDFSHIWGGRGVLARLGEKTADGQFGTVDSSFATQVNVVVNVVEEGFTAGELAQRLAHENAHSQDILLGTVRMREACHWSETAAAKVFQYCGVPARYDTSLMGCREWHPEWFNFHPTDFAAHNSAEFYGKMVDAWVRERLNMTPMDSYRRQSRVTELFWSEMEKNLLGFR
jgi:hypothetical protein